MKPFKNTISGQSFQAVCQDCNFTGPSRKTQNEAEKDAASHYNDPLYEDHVVSIDVSQKPAANSGGA